jgi:hypothetical protein
MAMTEEDTKNMIAGMLKNLDGEDMQGLSLDSLKDAMQHPKAAETVAELMPLESTSVQPGEPAPDFTLPYLPGSLPEGTLPGATVTLSDHFGNRPVALIFGSYT